MKSQKLKLKRSPWLLAAVCQLMCIIHLHDAYVYINQPSTHQNVCRCGPYINNSTINAAPEEAPLDRTKNKLKLKNPLPPLKYFSNGF